MSTQQLPLVFALKHLHIAWDDQHLTSPTQFSEFARLMQGQTDIPSAPDADVATALTQSASGTVPEGVELRLLAMACSGWPEDATLAFAGITAFGAGDSGRAIACAKRALQLNQNCTLARQLLKLLSAKSDVRCPFGTDATSAPNVAAILTKSS